MFIVKKLNYKKENLWCEVCLYQYGDGLKTPQEKNITNNIETDDNILESISKA